MASQGFHCSDPHFTSYGQLPYDSSRSQASTGEEQSVWEEEEEEVETESDREVECDLSNMEITQELRQCFVTTDQHRAERQWQQQLDAVPG